jgi:demethylmenaquinone methyltransferase/2-methoxy-6-polyprenyl-1,4-benzoquinol methylase
MNGNVGIENKAPHVRRMFASIARRYDLLNSILSLGFDRSWRNFTVSLIDGIPNALILDLAAGTGKIALLASRSCPESTVVGVDFCSEMLNLAKKRSTKSRSTPFIPQSWGKQNLGDTPKSPVRKNPAPLSKRLTESQFDYRLHLIQGDALRLPFPDNTFDCVTIGFALRNVTSIAILFAEMARVTKPGGRMVSLELTRPSFRVLEPLHKLYIKVVIKCIGGIVSGKWAAYAFLPRSILEFPSPQEVQKVMECAGWRDVCIYRLTFGAATVHTGVKE